MQKIDKTVKENDFKNHIDLQDKLLEAYKRDCKEIVEKTTEDYLKFCRDKGLKPWQGASLQAFMGGVA